MQVASHNATSLLGKLWSRFPTRGDRFPEKEPVAFRWLARKTPALHLPRYLLRFSFHRRPDNLSLHAFQSATLLYARLQSPFARPAFYLLQSRQGIAIWWWDPDGLDDNLAPVAEAGHEWVPEPVCQPMADGYHHIRHGEGYEARRIERGTVVASTWRSSAFDRCAWTAFLEANGGSPGLIAAGPPPAQPNEPARSTKPLGGRRLEAVIHPSTRMLLAFLLVLVASGLWWRGEAGALEEAHQAVEHDTRRLSDLQSTYALLAKSRQDLAIITSAHELAGKGEAATLLARIMLLARNMSITVLDIEVGSQHLKLLLQARAEPAKLRSFAAAIETMPEFSGVTSQPDAQGRAMRLEARVTS